MGICLDDDLALLHERRKLSCWVETAEVSEGEPEEMVLPAHLAKEDLPVEEPCDLLRDFE